MAVIPPQLQQFQSHCNPVISPDLKVAKATLIAPAVAVTLPPQTFSVSSSFCLFCALIDVLSLDCEEYPFLVTLFW
jgi:hypothetical protein